MYNTGRNPDLLSFAFPGLIEEEILNIGAEQIPYMRTEEFSELVLDSERILKELIGCDDGKVIGYTASGTAAMESAVVNYASKFDKILAINGGTFGKRWKEICNYHNYSCDEFEVDFGKDINYDQLDEFINKNKYDILLCQHHETSSGQLFDLNRIAEICRRNDVNLVVDAISSFLTDPFDMAKWNIDIAILSSQKGLNLPPGLSFLVISEKALKRGFNSNNYYLDIEDNLSNFKRGQTPFSPATTLFRQLHYRLSKLKELGIGQVLQIVDENARYFREACANNNWHLSAETPSGCITGFYIDNGRKICNELIKDKIYVMPSGNERLSRISHIGLQNKEILNILIDKIKATQNKLLL